MILPLFCHLFSQWKPPYLIQLRGAYYWHVPVGLPLHGPEHVGRWSNRRCAIECWTLPDTEGEAWATDRPTEDGDPSQDRERISRPFPGRTSPP